MRSFLLFVLCVALYTGSYAQFPMGGGAARAGGVPNIGHFYGRIMDAKTNKGVDAASVQLIQTKMDNVTKKQKDTVVGGMLTRGNGDFSLENLPILGQFRLKVTAIGFKTIDQKVAFDLKFAQGGDMTQAMNAVDKDLGNIKLEQDAQTLDAVVVTGSKPLIEMGIDRKIINVEKNINAAGGTAVDVMRAVPSVNVDIDGNVTLRNNAPQIFVDGRPTTLSLDQIPADAIQSVELITNPSAKFDASGGQAGILNIVLKKNRKAGYNGSIRAGVDSRGKFNGGGDLNVRQGKVNVFANAMYNQRKSKGWGYTDQLSTATDTATDTHTDNNSLVNGSFGFGRLGLDYFIDNRNTITISQSYVKGVFKNDNRNNYMVDTNANFYETYYRNTYGKGEFENFGTQLSFKHNFAKAGKEWTADVNFNKSKNDNNSDTRSRSFFDQAQNNPKTPNESLQNTQSTGDNTFVVMQTDYVNPINDKMKWEGGLRAQIRTSKSNQAIFYNGILNPLSSSNFKYTDYVYAGYATFSQKIKDKWSYQLGLRAESSNYDGEQIGKQSYSNSFPISLFPSVFITRNFESKQDLQINYSRRVNRPNFFQLMPNLDVSDTLAYSTGNPNLKPEFTHSLELSYQKTYGKRNNSFLATLFGKYTTNLIARYQDYRTLPGITKPVYVSTWENASDAYAAGLELVFRNNWTKWWDMTFSTNVYYSKINGSNVVAGLENERTSYSAKINNTFKWNKGWSIQLSGDYISKSALPVSTSNSGGGGGRGGFMGGGMFGGGSPSTVQGYINSNFGVDMGLRKEFQIKKNTATVSVNWSDIFRTRRFFSHSEAANFVQEDWRRRDPQIVRVNFSYRFGKMDIGLFKRKNLKGEQEGMQNGMQGVGQ